MDASAALAQVVAHLPGGGEPRPGQVAMAAAIEEAIEGGDHVIVQAGTGTGKSLAYLVPALLSGRRAVVATATKALQDQLIGKDLPFLAEHLGRPFRAAVLKGRSNYLCLQRAREVIGASEQGRLELGVDPRASITEIRRLVEWAVSSASGDRADLSFEPTTSAWGAVSVTARECPGRTRCPVGDACFAERARDAAAEADVVVVNQHLYGMHLASEGALLPEHDVLVIDEAHQLEDVISNTAGFEIGPGSFTALARLVRGLLTDPAPSVDLEASAGQLADALGEHSGRRLRRLDEAVAAAVAVATGRVERAAAAVRAVDSQVGDVPARRQRALRAASTLLEELHALVALDDDEVAWVEGPPDAARLKVAPLDVAIPLAPLWSLGTVVLTSATIPVGLAERFGLAADQVTVLDVGSPFDHGVNGLLYCAAGLPDPRQPGYEAAMHEELAALIEAAGGRTLALFTSWRAMHAAAEALEARLQVPLLVQGAQPKPRLVDAFAADESTCLFATMSFWQGVDLPGRTLSLVTIDRLPFPRPDEPLLQARRERARNRAFATIDLPRAATLLAQGAGRLLRTAADRGVVAVFDPRLATAGYRWDIVRALPPMRRTRHRAEAEAFLRDITAGPDRRSGDPDP